MTEFRGTELGTLPSDWNDATIGDLFAIQQGASLSPKRRKGDSPRPFLRTANVFWSHLDLTEVDSMDFTEAEVEKLSLRPHDLLVCEGGDIGRTAMWRGEIENCCYQNHLHRLRAKDSNIESEFYMYWMQAALTLLDLYRGEGNKTTIPNLSQSRLKSFPVPLPPLPEQRAIARGLSTVQRAVEAQDKLLAAARELKKALMRQLFTQGLDANGAVKETEIGVMPVHWQLAQVRDVAEIKYGYQTSIPKVPPKNGVQIISTAEITSEGRLNLSKIRTVEIPGHLIEKYRVHRHDVLFNWRNAQEHVGKTAIVEREPLVPTTFASFILRLRPLDKLSARYLHFMLSYLRQIRTFFVLSRRAVNQANFNANELGDLKIAVPPLSEQHQIARILSTVDKKIEAEEQRKAALQALFKTMLQQLMTGQLRVY